MVRTEERLAGAPVTLAIVAAAAAAYLCPPVAAALVYDRSAILGGEIWRLVTGPLAHFSGGHLFFNALVFAAAGHLAERRRPRLFARLCLASSLAASLFLFCLSPGIEVFGGLSGIATMAVVFLAVDEIRAGSRSSLLWSAVLALTAGKIILETALGSPLFAAVEGVVLVPSAHITGALTALAGQGFLLQRKAVPDPSA